jgi:hypothetical protein
VLPKTIGKYSIRKENRQTVHPFNISIERSLSEGPLGFFKAHQGRSPTFQRHSSDGDYGQVSAGLTPARSRGEADARPRAVDRRAIVAILQVDGFHGREMGARMLRSLQENLLARCANALAMRFAGQEPGILGFLTIFAAAARRARKPALTSEQS